MTNEEAIRNLSRKKLAGLLIKTVTYPDYDEGCDGEMHYCGDWTYYRTSDGQEFDGYKDALLHECRWLAQEVTACGTDDVQ